MAVVSLDDGQFVDTTTGEVIQASDVDEHQAAPDEADAGADEAQEIERVPDEDNLNRYKLHVRGGGKPMPGKKTALDLMLQRQRANTVGSGMTPQERAEYEAEREASRAVMIERFPGLDR